MHDSHNRGAACEYTAAAHFASQGWTIFWTPNGSNPCDFIIRKRGETKGVQVKSAAWVEQGGVKYLRASVSPSRPYVSSDFDLLAIVGPSERIWTIPFEHIPETSTVYLEKKKDGEVETYEWDQWLTKT